VANGRGARARGETKKKEHLLSCYRMGDGVSEDPVSRRYEKVTVGGGARERSHKVVNPIVKECS